MTTPWVCIPTAMKDHVPAQLDKWRERGYKVAILTDHGVVTVRSADADLWLNVDHYPGIWKSWNMLAKAVMSMGTQVCVLAGDDMDPEPRHTAQELAHQYLEKYPNGFGIMQPAGDPQGDLIDGQRNAGRICGSPWMGVAWVRRAYGGDGPVNSMYHAFYADEELYNVAKSMGVLWVRQDIMQYHRHWSWGHLPKQTYHSRNQEYWSTDQHLFMKERDAGFPASKHIS